MSPDPESVDEPPPSDSRPYLTVGGDRDDFAGAADDPSGLRPYLLTSGRAEPVDQTLEIEAQVQTVNPGGGLSFEYREIVELCVEPMSVAEVAARLKLHIGVARVLIADLAAQGYVIVERPSFPAHNLNLIERVIRGLEAIR
jgi:hypothetical protein